MINLEKANCSTPPGRNPAIFKIRDDIRSQKKYSVLCKRKQEETSSILALSTLQIPLPTLSQDFVGCGCVPARPLRSRQPQEARHGMGWPVPPRTLHIWWGPYRKSFQNPLTHIPLQSTRRLIGSGNELKPWMRCWQLPHRAALARRCHRHGARYGASGDFGAASAPCPGPAVGVSGTGVTWSRPVPSHQLGCVGWDRATDPISAERSRVCCTEGLGPAVCLCAPQPRSRLEQCLALQQHPHSVVINPSIHIVSLTHRSPEH